MHKPRSMPVGHGPVTDAQPERRHQVSWGVLIVVCVAQFMVTLDATVVNVALPSIGRDLHAPGTGIGAVSIAYVVSIAVVIPAKECAATIAGVIGHTVGPAARAGSVGGGGVRPGGLWGDGAPPG